MNERNFLGRKTRYQARNFVIIGLLSTLASYGVLNFLFKYMQYNSVFIAAIVSNSCGIMVSYTGNYFWVFKAKSGMLRKFITFIIFYGVIGVFNSLVLFGSQKYLVSNLTVSFLIATVLSAILTFCSNKMFVFKAG